MKILGIIPARGGSKGIPRKNIIDINGKPLINYTIEAGLQAKEQGIIDELIVSTDDKEIYSIAEKTGVHMPFLRPKELGSDKTKSVDVIIHALEFLKEKHQIYDAVMLLQPTTPLRTVEDIKNSVELFSSEKSTSLISCYKEEYICDMVTYHKEGKQAIACNKFHNAGKRRQDLPDLYVRNGAIYIANTDFLLSSHLVFDNVPLMYVMPKERSVNIDCMDDVEMLRWKLSK